MAIIDLDGCDFYDVLGDCCDGDVLDDNSCDFHDAMIDIDDIVMLLMYLFNEYVMPL
jgi:hypothetical protein